MKPEIDDQYTYNTANQISQIAGLAQTRNFTYDNINRLIGMSDGTNTESYTYDAVGNRTMSGYVTGAFNRLTAKFGNLQLQCKRLCHRQIVALELRMGSREPAGFGFQRRFNAVPV